MLGYHEMKRLFPAVASLVVGVFTALVLFRKNLLDSIVSSSGGSFDIFAALLLLVAPFCC